MMKNLYFIILISILGWMTCKYFFSEKESINTNIQLSRIDFQQDIDSTESSKIKVYIENMKGVQSVYVNVKENLLVYTYDNSLSSSIEVYNQLIKWKAYKATRFISNIEKDKASGCPIHRINFLLFKIINIFQ